ncbi:VOC family protein [Arthrobacter sp. MYb222]|uniref:VOC family protein n=1 Tax=Arthrobacter sp. MYb222 TaxID=1848599 RepID=UPI0011B034AC|nr:VOC family protein [Arthrobacter sp. MYb222]
MVNIVWWEIETETPEKFMSFHRTLHGWTFDPSFENSELEARYWIIRQDGVGIGGLQQAPAGPRPVTGTRIYFEVDNLEQLLEKVQELGGRVERRRTDLGGNDRWFATFQDTCGVSFGLWTDSAPKIGS